ncbi:hypothetical protein DMX06_07680 [Pseudomonas mosselii]|nr:hypothetical protein DMX06_07680 [Pseudomonas mosselii]
MCSGVGSGDSVRLETAGAALRPFRDTRPLLHGNALACRSGLVPRTGCKAAPVHYRWVRNRSTS